MTALSTKVPIKDVLSNITITVQITGLVKWRFQLRVARWLIRLAALIINMDVDIKRKQETR